MGDLKFRYWDFHLKKMVYSDEWTHVNKLQNLSSFFRTAAYYAFENNVMQFTGFVDSAGNEIYVGDIIRVPSHYEGDYWIEEYEGQILFDGSFYVDNFGDIEYVVGLCDIEVIGNIYKNDEGRW